MKIKKNLILNLMTKSEPNLNLVAVVVVGDQNSSGGVVMFVMPSG